MRRAWTVAENRAAEEIALALVPPGALMQRAAAGLATVCAGELRRRHGGVSGRHVVLLVGGGNNGGDALFAGERLARRGARVDAVLLSPGRAHRAGLAALQAAGGRLRDRVDPQANLVVDGIVGLGASMGLRPDAASVVAQIPEHATVVAVDLPSGVDPDGGELPQPDPDGRRRHVTADVTVTFGAEKGCLLLPPADAAAGRVQLVDIGLGPLLTTRPLVERLDGADAAARWPVPGRAAHKYTRGVLGVIAGSGTFPGAAVLATSGAIRAGVGMVRYLGPSAAASAVLAARPETVAVSGRVQAWLVGSGIDPERDADQVDAARAAIGDGLPTVVDAGGLDQVEASDRRRPLLLTPHAGELAALLTRLGERVTRDQVEAAPLRHARTAVELTGATVLVKGATTLVVDPPGQGRCGEVRSQADATPWLATAGAGDVLAGVAGALLAAGLSPVDAGSLATLVHGRAARSAARGGPLAALDVADAVPVAVRELLG